MGTADMRELIGTVVGQWNPWKDDIFSFFLCQSLQVLDGRLEGKTTL